jgi:hypothetical protein
VDKITKFRYAQQVLLAWILRKRRMSIFFRAIASILINVLCQGIACEILIIFFTGTFHTSDVLCGEIIDDGLILPEHLMAACEAIDAIPNENCPPPRH